MTVIVHVLLKLGLKTDNIDKFILLNLIEGIKTIKNSLFKPFLSFHLSNRIDFTVLRPILRINFIEAQ